MVAPYRPKKRTARPGELQALTSIFPTADVISSVRNPLIRRLVQLDKDAAVRHREARCLIWGWKFVEEALERPGLVERVLVGGQTARKPIARTLLRRVQRSGIAIYAVEERILDRIIPGCGDQGILALGRISPKTPDEMVADQPSPILLIADRIQDPANLGPLLRVGEAVGVAGLLTMPGTVDPYHTRAVRASAGSVLRVPVGPVASLADLQSWCRHRGVRTVVALAKGGVPCHEADLTGSLALVVGNEGSGVSAEWVQAADTRVTIPLQAPLESLNVTVAAGMLLYEMVRQREK